jgi:hypothetical protein
MLKKKSRSRRTEKMQRCGKLLKLSNRAFLGQSAAAAAAATAAADKGLKIATNRTPAKPETNNQITLWQCAFEEEYCLITDRKPLVPNNTTNK